MFLIFIIVLMYIAVFLYALMATIEMMLDLMFRFNFEDALLTFVALLAVLAFGYPMVVAIKEIF